MMDPAEVVFTRKFSAAHRIAADPGVCQRVHGHNYKVEISVRRLPMAQDATSVSTSTGFVVPADVIKKLVDKKYDHKLILAENDDVLSWNVRHADDWIVRTPGPPSTENLARWICDDVLSTMKLLHGTIIVVHVTVWETDTIRATAQGQT